MDILEIISLVFDIRLLEIKWIIEWMEDSISMLLKFDEWMNKRIITNE